MIERGTMLAPWADSYKKTKRGIYLPGDVVCYPGIGNCTIKQIRFCPEYRLQMYVLKPFRDNSEILVPIHKINRNGAFFVGKYKG